LEILDGLTIDGERVDVESYLERLTIRHNQNLEEHEGSGSLEQAETQLLELEGAARRMASALGGLRLEARQAIFGEGLGKALDDGIFREGFAFEGGWLPSAEGFSEFAQACALAARECKAGASHVPNGLPRFRPLLNLTPTHALVGSCEDALIRVGRPEKLKNLVWIVAELATGRKPDLRFAEREISKRAHRPHPS
jgi:hypothetical protein